MILAKLLAENKSGNLTDEQVKFAQTIYSAGNDLLNLVNDILDLSRIEAGEIQVRTDTVSIPRFMENLSRTFQPVAAERKLSFTVEADSKAPASLISDPQRLDQILKNLLSNAFKFTETGAVTVRVSPARNGMLAFSVTDTGIGIPQEQQRVIFEAFRQADGSTHRKYGGTGLGLSISQDLVRLLGGEILVESTVNEGSTFTLIVPRESSTERADRKPAARAAAAAVDLYPAIKPEPPVTPSHKSRPVPHVDDDRTKLAAETRTLLVVEDDERFARILYDLAHEVGFQCVIATSAADGTALAREIQPAAVVLDMHLPAGCVRMTKLIGDLLDFSNTRLTGSLPANPVGTSFLEITKKVVMEHQLADETARIEVTVVGDLQGTWDELRMCQAVSNLIANALDHGDRSEPVAILLDGSDPDEVVWSIHNKGHISDSVLPQVFDPFRSSARKNSTSSGLGLGLYIVAQIVKTHLGSIAVDSNPISGTRFTIRLPRHVAAIQQMKQSLSA